MLAIICLVGLFVNLQVKGQSPSFTFFAFTLKNASCDITKSSAVIPS